jgi:predicted aspartyl protease
LSTSVAIRFSNNKILVPVLVNDNLPATLLLDTGASFTVISPELARRAGLDPATATARSKVQMASGQEIEAPLVRLPAITVGAAKIANFGVAVYAFTVQDRAGQPLAIDGFLGIDFLARFTMIVDPRAGTLTLQLPETR